MTQVTSKVLRVGELFTMGRFAVPWHQRYYDWSTDEVLDLLRDVHEALDEDRTSYFLGSIMLVEDDDFWHINDGQQRMITLSLLVAALCRRFAGQRETDAAHELLALRILFDRSDTAVTKLDDTTRDEPRIRPPRQDRSRYTQIIRGHDIGTNGKMTSAWNEIGVFLAGFNQSAARSFFEFLVYNVEIGVLYVPETEDANAVFEALNGRGKQLDDVDLIRNHLYSYFTGEGDRVRRATVHDQLESVLLSNRTTSRSSEYFRCYFQCRYGYIQKKRFYRETRAKIRENISSDNSEDYVYNLVGQLADKRFVELFRTITATNPSPEFITAFLRASSTSKQKRNLSIILSELLNYKVARPLVFALLRKFVEAQGKTSVDRRKIATAVHRSLRDLSSFVIRVSFCEAKFEPSRFEAAFANGAKRIATATNIAGFDIKTILRECDDRRIMEDSRFVTQLVDVELKDERRAKRLLFGINAQEDREARALDYDGSTVEHILPQSDTYWSGWTGFSGIGSEIGNWVYRIGNLTLLGDSDNFARREFNANFEAKRSIFEESPFGITREVASAPEWSPDAIRTRSSRLARTAARVWTFSRQRKQ